MAKPFANLKTSCIGLLKYPVTRAQSSAVDNVSEEHDGFSILSG